LITAGIDIGAKAVKVVLLKDGKIVLGTGAVPAGGDTEAATREAYDRALKAAGIAANRVSRGLATGTGRKECPLTEEEITEVAAAARAGVHWFPGCRTVVDVGAEEGRAARCDPAGKVIDFAYNEKCAAGAGVFAEAMARALEVPLEALGPLALKSTGAVKMSAQCVVFTESEVVTLLHDRTPREDIARAVLDAIASRIVSMVEKLGFEREVVLVGGMARNAGFVESLKRGLESEVLVPEAPEHAGALGAALAAGRHADIPPGGRTRD